MQIRNKKYFEKPKVYNPFGIHRPFVFRWKGSVIPKVLPHAILVTILSVIITYLYKKNLINLSIKQSFITVLGLIVSLLLAYRTNTAYDRYSEGLRTWSNMVGAIRNMTRCIWVNVNVEDYEEIPDKIIDDKTRAEHLLEKKTAINLLLGFAVATKHYLRDENVKLDDLKPLVSKIDPNSPGIPININDKDHSPKNVKDSRDTFGKRFMKIIKKLLPTYNSSYTIDNNLPFKLTFYLSSYIHKQKRLKTTDDATIGLLYSNLSCLNDCLTTFERILRSPIPLAYAIHLTQATWIYCLSLPFQLVADLDWVTIPVTFLITLTLFGVEQIANEIENPFGWDDNDLDLDGFCRLLNYELKLVTSETIPPINDWMFGKKSIPFETRNITSNLDLDEVKSLLSIASGKFDDININDENDDGNV